MGVPCDLLRRAGVVAPLAAAVAALALAGCGATRTTRAAAPVGPRSFAWLTAGWAPPSWVRVALADGESLARPPGWRTIGGDHGTISFARPGRDGGIGAYLNATPGTRAETLANWMRFRVAHNVDEGDRQVRPLAGATGVRVGASRVSCVIDGYTTSRHRYREIACIVAGSRGRAVVVGAAQPAQWARQRPVLERAIADFAAG